MILQLSLQRLWSGSRRGMAEEERLVVVGAVGSGKSKALDWAAEWLGARKVDADGFFQRDEYIYREEFIRCVNCGDKENFEGDKGVVLKCEEWVAQNKADLISQHKDRLIVQMFICGVY